MNLKTWQTQNNISNKKLSEMVRAHKVKCHESMVCHFHAGRKCFSPTVAMVIEDITNGAVTLREIFDR
jgi:DNA-binding transcriptional regulator YdaS (Cro superfamily)